MLNLLLLAGLMIPANAQAIDHTRGIGVYPGSPSEYFAPEVTWQKSGNGLHNVALHRAAYASSAVDYNHTAHLVTDGICDNSEPATLSVSTPDGRLPRREAEWSIDGGPFSRNVLMGDHTWLRYDGKMVPDGKIKKIRLQGMVTYDKGKAKNGYSLSCQTSDDGVNWNTAGATKGEGLPGELLHYKLHSDPNKQEERNLLPARVLNETIRLDGPVDPHHFRVNMDMDGAAHWDVREVKFLDANDNEIDVLPSRRFSSMWISDGGGDQWIYVDLGKSLPLEEVRLHWLLPPKKGAVEVSDDATTWTKVADIGSESSVPVNDKGRYVRLSLQEAASPEGYALREMEVLSDEKKGYAPHAAAEIGNGRQDLSGGNWTLQRASEVSAPGEAIASSGFDNSQWIPATVPGTVLASFINIGAVPDPNKADNVDQISESYFRSDFWYRDEFEVPSLPESKQLWLNFDGINWKANVFLNGHRLGRIEGAFKRGKFNVTGILRKGINYLAVEIECNEHFAAVKEKDKNSTQFNGGLLGADNPTFHASVGWDWITTVRGRESGIWNEVYLSTSGDVGISDPYVATEISQTDGTVSVTPSVFVRNYENHAVEGVLSGHIGDVDFSKKITIPALTEQEETFKPETFAQLKSKDFKLWWPNGYGSPHLYDAGFTFTPDNHGESSSIDFKAGLRQMEYVDAGDSLRLYVNGRRFIPLGGNWGFDEHNLLYRSREYDIAAGYHRDMNFTMIRNWVGQVGDEAFYDACDRNGIMIWQDFWLANPVDGPDPYNTTLFLDNAEDYVRRMRIHPGIALYCGRNEGMPSDALDRSLRDYVHRLAPGLDYISHSSEHGVSGGGPYRALPAEEYFKRQSGMIHSERGMPNVMNIESLRRTMSPDSIWPQSAQWGQHDYTLLGAQRASDFNKLVDEGFGQSADAEEFARRAQLINYNGYRAMFESTSKSRAGLLLWMSHPCWPSMVWQTYDYYFDPTAAYFGAKKACEPLHAQYNALTDSIETVNLFAGDRKGITLQATVFDLNGKPVSRKKLQIDSPDDSMAQWIKLGDMVRKAPSEVYFLRLQLSDKKGPISENLYIMSGKENDYKALSSLSPARPAVKTEISSSDGGKKADVTLHNKSNVPAVFLRLNLKGEDGEQILPAVYSDNYVTLMPGEKRTVTVSWRDEDARGQKAHVEVTESFTSEKQ